MKKLIVLFLLLLISTPCFSQEMARMNVALVGVGVTAGGTCQNSTFTYSGVLSGINIGDSANDTYGGYATAGFYPLSHTVCGVTYTLSTIGTITGATFTAKVWSINHSTVALVSILATSTGVAGGAAWSETPVTFTFPTPYAISQNADIAITVECSACDLSNYARLHSTNEDATGVAATSNWNASGTFGNYITKYPVMTVQSIQ